GPLERGERTERTGTRLYIRADRSIFSPARFDRRAIRRRIEELAPWNPELTFELMSETIREPRGTVAWIDRLAAEHDAPLPRDVFVTRGLRDGVFVEVAMGWSSGSALAVRSFSGQNATRGGGTHERGFWRGLVAAVAGQRPRAL